MRPIAELPPAKDRDLLMKRIEAIKGLAEEVDVPDSPLGKPSAHAIAVASLALQAGLNPIAHIRIRDINLLALKSLLGAAKLLGIRRVVPLMGDPPALGAPVDQLRTEDAVRAAKEEGLVVGAMLSMRRNYAERLKIGADFYLILNLRRPEDMEGLRGVEAYPYLLIRTSRNAELMARLGQPSLSLEEVRRFLDALYSYGVKAVVVSAPGDFDAELAALGEFRR
jgi:5,10-methylenetetrahydrofolate reductase|nr:MAG: 5,10-methylenetetrahydrofolate reductase [Thermoproteus sp. AZ2]